MRTSLIAILMLLLQSPGYGQGRDKKTKPDNFDNYGYMVNVETYTGLSEKGFSPEEIYKRLGNANYLTGQYKEAADWYGKLFRMEGIKTEPGYMYRYAQALKSLERYEESNLWMEKFSTVNTLDLRAMKYIEDTGYLEKIREPLPKYRVQNLLSINSPESDFAPTFRSNELIFSSSRNPEHSSKNKNIPYLDLFVTSMDNGANYRESTPFSKELNTKANESSTVFSQDGKTVYFTRNYFGKNTFNRDKKGVSRLKIYKSEFRNGSWGPSEELPFNSDNYSIAHPALGKDDKKLYFSSDMPGTLGASDIFEVDILEDGSYGEPKNLGAAINTEGKETFPFISERNILYFASDGHPGLGGLDIFSVDLEGNGQVTNMGSPINSINDDFSLIINESESTGYFASNREGGVGSDDIYSFSPKTHTEIQYNTTVDGIALDMDTEEPLGDVVIIALDQNGDKIAETRTDGTGKYSITIQQQNKENTLQGSKPGYEKASRPILLSASEKHMNNIRLELEQTGKVAKVGSDLAKILKLSPIYFDLNSSYLREDASLNLDQVVNYMQKRPDIKIEVGSHTDSREEDNYNLWLSERRAMRTVEYIISKGIDPSRISGKGYGETQLINNCRNGIPCSDGEHQLNRRSEFIVLQ